MQYENLMRAPRKVMKKGRYVHMFTCVVCMQYFYVKGCSLLCYCKNFCLAALRQVRGNLPQYISHVLMEVVAGISFFRGKLGLC